MAWLGRKKLAFVPVYRSNAHPPDQIPADWTNQILRRVLFDPDPRTRADRSLRAYIHAASSGRADLDVAVLPMQTVEGQDVPPTALEGALGAQLRSEGFHAAAIVMLGGPGAGTSAGFWVRFVMLEGVGVWAMEFMHSLTGFADLYPFGGDMGAFDEMACSCGTHPSAYTKAAIRWLDKSAIAQHSGRASIHGLHCVGLVQPPPSGRSAAVRIGSAAPYLMVEARQRVDQFDLTIPSEGVIVYRVQTTDPLGHAQNNLAPLDLLTPNALTPGQAFTSDTDVVVKVTGAVPGGFTVMIEDRNAAFDTGQLLFYRDMARDGTGDVANPSIIGLGGWQDYKFLFSGGNGIIYAVDHDGRLLFYRDATQDGTGDIAIPSVIGLGGWQDYKFLFSGGNGIIYAVDHDGRLLFYRDATQDGTGDIASPSVIGLGGWQDYKFVFSGGEGIIYAVDHQGGMSFYRDTTQDGTGDVHSPLFVSGGWTGSKFIFSGGPFIGGPEETTNGTHVLYSVDAAGDLHFHLLSILRDIPGRENPAIRQSSIIGHGGWRTYKFLFYGGDGILYAVVA